MSGEESQREERDYQILINENFKKQKFPGRVEIYEVKEDRIGLMYFNGTEKNLIVCPWKRYFPDSLNVSKLIEKIKDTEKKLSSLHYIS